MTAWLAVPAAGALLLVAATVVSARRRARERESRRVEELGRLADRLETALGALRQPSRAAKTPSTPPAVDAPLVAERLPGRTALLEAVAGEIAQARANGARLTAVLVRAGEERRPEEVVDAVREVAGRPAYAVGPRSVAFTLPGVGRADGLGAVARIESVTVSSGHAVEWKPDETAVELVARLLERPPEPGAT